MSDTHATLVYMANQIARNFAVMGDTDAALATADHIAHYWDPRMKAAIWGDAHGLSPIATAAFDELRKHGAPPSQTKATADVGPGGTGGSDAG